MSSTLTHYLTLRLQWVRSLPIPLLHATLIAARDHWERILAIKVKAEYAIYTQTRALPVTEDLRWPRGNAIVEETNEMGCIFWSVLAVPYLLEAVEWELLGHSQVWYHCLIFIHSG